MAEDGGKKDRWKWLRNLKEKFRSQPAEDPTSSAEVNSTKDSPPPKESVPLQGAEEIDAYLTKHYTEHGYKKGSLTHPRIKILFPDDFVLDTEALMEVKYEEDSPIQPRSGIECYFSDSKEYTKITQTYPNEEEHYGALKEYDPFYVEGQNSYAPAVYLAKHLIDRQLDLIPDEGARFQEKHKILNRFAAKLNDTFNLEARLGEEFRNFNEPTKIARIENFVEDFYLNVRLIKDEKFQYIGSSCDLSTSLWYAGHTLESFRDQIQPAGENDQERQAIYEKYKPLYKADKENHKKLEIAFLEFIGDKNFENISTWDDTKTLEKEHARRFDEEGNLLPLEETVIPLLHGMIDIDLKHNAEQKKTLHEQVDAFKAEIQNLNLHPLEEIKARLDGSPSLTEEVDISDLLVNHETYITPPETAPAPEKEVPGDPTPEEQAEAPEENIATERDDSAEKTETIETLPEEQASPPKENIETERDDSTEKKIFSDRAKIGLGIVGLAGTALAVAGGEKTTEEKQKQATAEGKEFKPKKRWFLRIVAAVAAIGAIDAAIRGDESVLGKFTAKYLSEKNTNKNIELT